MPKDLIHFKIAQRTARRLADTPYYPCIEQEVDGLLLGSVFHDALFYAVTPQGRPLEALAHNFHGAKGQDTFKLIRLQAAHARSAADKSLPIALLVGQISHLYADMVMHPLVWHLTGNYYDDDPKSKSKARQRHRALESLLDMVACPEMLGNARYRLHTILRRCPDMLNQGVPISRIGDLAFMQPDVTRTEFAKAWNSFATLQRMYSITPLARTLFAIRRVVPRQIAEIIMLFYAPQLMKQAEEVQGEIQFIHPVTGRELNNSLDELMEAAATKAATLCRQLEPAIFGEAPLLLPGPGPSMDAGLSGVPSKGMHAFVATPFPDLE